MLASQAATVTGPSKAPVMIGLVNVAFYLRKRMYGGAVSSALEMLAAAQAGLRPCPSDKRLASRLMPSLASGGT